MAICPISSLPYIFQVPYTLSPFVATDPKDVTVSPIIATLPKALPASPLLATHTSPRGSAESPPVRESSRAERWRKSAASLGEVGGSARCFFQGSTVPMGQLGASFVGGLAKLKKRGARRRRLAHGVVHQEELVELQVVFRGVRPNPSLAEARRFGSYVGIEGGRAEAAAGPKADAADLV